MEISVDTSHECFAENTSARELRFCRSIVRSFGRPCIT